MASDNQIGQAVVSEAARPSIVIIDDDHSVRESTRLLLETNGYSVRDHASAESFLTSGWEEALILLIDHNMPGMTGGELLEMLHAKYGKVLALMMTGRTNPTLEAQCNRLGVKLLRKPFAEHHLILAIEAASRVYASRHMPLGKASD